MKNKYEIIIKSIMSGILIAIGCTVFLSVDDKVIGSLLFTFGLLTIMKFQLHLFTGRVGYANKDNVLELITVLLFNFLGTAITAFLISNTSTYIKIYDRCNTLVESKISQPYISLFISAMFCGMLMFIAVDSYKKNMENIIPILCVAIFILSGYCHSIADCYYMILLSKFNIRVEMTLVLGNAVGSIITNKLVNYN